VEVTMGILSFAQEKGKEKLNWSYTTVGW
jgi:hypothetical protein